MRTCCRCGEEKVITEFPFQNKQKNQRMYWCGECKRKYQRERYRREPKKVKEAVMKWHKGHRFNTCLIASRAHAKKKGYVPCVATPREIEVAFTGKCHVCGVPEMECRTRLHLDHDHATGVFRGWLCRKCNTALGLLEDSPERALALMKYAEHVAVLTPNS